MGSTRRDVLRMVGLASVAPWFVPGRAAGRSVAPGIGDIGIRGREWRASDSTHRGYLVAQGGPRVFRAPGKMWAAQVRQFIAEAHAGIASGRGIRIQRIFEILPINPESPGLVQRLSARGSVTVAKGVASNDGDEVDGKFGDRNFNQVSVVFPPEFRASVHDDGVTISTKLQQPVKIVFHNLDPKLRIGANQRLDAINFNPKIVSYLLHENSDATRQIQLDIDLDYDGPPGVTRIAGLYWVANKPKDCPDTFIGPFTSKCCGGKEKAADGKCKFFEGGGSTQTPEPEVTPEPHECECAKHINVKVTNFGSFMHTFEYADTFCRNGIVKTISLSAWASGWISVCSSEALSDGYGQFKARIKGNQSWTFYALLRDGEEKKL